MPQRAMEILEMLLKNRLISGELNHRQILLEKINFVRERDGDPEWNALGNLNNRIFNAPDWNRPCRQMMEALGCYDRGLTDEDLLGDRWEEIVYSAFSNCTLRDLRELVEGKGAQGSLVVSETNGPSAADGPAAMILAPEEMHNGDQKASGPHFRRGVSRLCYAFRAPFDGWLTLLLRTPPAGGGRTMQGYCVNALLGTNANGDRPYFFQGPARFQVERTLPEGTPPGPRELYAVWSREQLGALDGIGDLTSPCYLDTKVQANIVREIRDVRGQGKGHAQVFGASFVVLE